MVTVTIQHLLNSKDFIFICNSRIVNLLGKYVYLKMKSHKGMRPHDIAILLKIISLADNDWLNKDLAGSLFISPSEISESLSRSAFSGLLAADKKTVNKPALMGFLVNGLKYMFPVQPGTVAKGTITASMAPILRDYFPAEDIYVWPELNGGTRGLVIEPLYPGAIKASKQDPMLYDLLALCDVFRVGKPKEVQKAAVLLTNIFGQGDDYISC